jgi:hypothetical protein
MTRRKQIVTTGEESLRNSFQSCSMVYMAPSLRRNAVAFLLYVTNASFCLLPASCNSGQMCQTVSSDFVTPIFLRARLRAEAEYFVVGRHELCACIPLSVLKLNLKGHVRNERLDSVTTCREKFSSKEFW